MKVELLDHFQAFLLRSPFYTSTFMLVREWPEPVVTMRVENLARFREEFRARVSFRIWRNKEQTWVAAVPFLLDIGPQFHVMGMPCLNPRHAVDYDVMQKFAWEEQLRFLFLSPDLEDAEEVQVPWPAAQRARVKQLIHKIDEALTGERLTSAFDPDFERARKELVAFYTTTSRKAWEERWWE